MKGTEQDLNQDDLSATLCSFGISELKIKHTKISYHLTKEIINSVSNARDNLKNKFNAKRL